MPAAALPPPTSPYLQALERASGVIKQQASAGKYGYDDESDGCWVCGNATRASQAYCSTTCRDSDTLQRSISDLRSGQQHQQELLDDLILYTAAEQLQLSPMLSPAVSAVPALVPSASSRKNRSGTTTPVAHASSAAAVARRSSSNATDHQTTSARRSNTNGNNHGNISALQQHHAPLSSAGEGSSSSPPSSSATSSPSKPATDDDRIEEDIENLLLPPPIGAGLDKKVAAANGFGYAYPYGIRAGTAVVIPKPAAPTKAQPHRTTAANHANSTVPLTSTGMRKSASQQSNRHSKHQADIMLSPGFAPKSMGAVAATTIPSAGGLSKEAKSRPTSRPTTGSSTSTATHDSSNTPPLNPSEVITFRRRHHAPDSMNGHQKSSHGSGNVSVATSSSASPALQAMNGVTTVPKPASRRHSSQGSQITSPKMVPAFSPLVKARSTTSKAIPTLQDTGTNGTTASSSTTTSTSSPLIKPVDGQGVMASPSLAASSLTDLLLRTTSRPESSTTASRAQQQHHQAVAAIRRASKSDTVLENTLHGNHGNHCSPSSSATKEASGNSRAGWLQRNKLTKNFFSFNGASSTLSRIGGATAAEGERNAIASHATCGRKNCPVNHQISSHQHPLATFFTPLSRRVSEPVSPFASPAIFYADHPKNPFEESFASRSASDSFTATLRNTSLSPASPALVGEYSNSSVTNGSAVKRAVTSPAVINTPSPGGSGIKPQDYSGFAGFLFALHNQRKGNATASQQSGSGSASYKIRDSSAPIGTKASFQLYDATESSESGYDAQDEEVSAARGRGRASGRKVGADRPTTVESGETLFKSEEQANVAKPAPLKEKLVNAVRASNDRAASSVSSSDSVEASNSAAGSPATSNSSARKPTRFLFGRGNAFRNSNLNEAAVVAAERTIQPQNDKTAQPLPRARHNHSTSVGEGSQYIVSLRGQTTKGSQVENIEDDSLSEELLLNDGQESPSAPLPDRPTASAEARGRPTARRRSSGNGRMPLVSPFTALDRETREVLQEQTNEDGGRGRSRARGSAALHRSVSPARSSSRVRGRDSPRLRLR